MVTAGNTRTGRLGFPGQGQELSQMSSLSSAVSVNRDFWSWLALLPHSGKRAVITHCFLPKPILVPQITLLFSRVCDHMLLFAKRSSVSNNDCIELSLIGLVSSWLFLRLLLIWNGLRANLATNDIIHNLSFRKVMFAFKGK